VGGGQAGGGETRWGGEPPLPAETDRRTKSAPPAVKSAVRDRAKAVPFFLEALSRYEVMERDDWLVGLELGLGEGRQVQQVRRGVYEQLLWLADDVLYRGQDHRSGRKLSAAQAAGEALAYLRKAEAAWPPTFA